MICEVVENHKDFRIDISLDGSYLVWCYWAKKYVGTDIHTIDDAHRFIQVLRKIT